MCFASGFRFLIPLKNLSEPFPLHGLLEGGLTKSWTINLSQSMIQSQIDTRPDNLTVFTRPEGRAHTMSFQEEPGSPVVQTRSWIMNELRTQTEMWEEQVSS